MAGLHTIEHSINQAKRPPAKCIAARFLLVGSWLAVLMLIGL
jgi:hypothetical protein